MNTHFKCSALWFVHTECVDFSWVPLLVCPDELDKCIVLMFVAINFKHYNWARLILFSLKSDLISSLTDSGDTIDVWIMVSL